MDLNNLSMGDLKEKILSFADKKTLIKFGISFGAIILFLVIYFAILNPMVEKRKNTYNDQIKKINEISQFENDIINTKRKIKKIKPIYEKTAAYGHFGRIPESDGSFSLEKTDKSDVFSK